jgi:DNA-binding PadR family transcriptional regulator
MSSVATRKTTPYVILGFLAQGKPLSGYELRKSIALSVGHFWNESFGQLYPELQRLTKLGLIQPVADRTATRNRARYRITPAGKRALTQWAATPAPPERVRNELLLKTFFGAAGDRAALVAHISDAAQRWRADVTRYAEAQQQLLHEDANSTDLVHSIVTLRHGRWVRAARVRWAEEALELLDLAQRKGNRALIARLKQLEKALP